MSKRTFNANTFASHTFASGNWRGEGVGVVEVMPAARQVYVAGAESHDVYAAGGLGQVYVSGAEAIQVVVR